MNRLLYTPREHSLFGSTLTGELEKYNEKLDVPIILQMGLFDLDKCNLVRQQDNGVQVLPFKLGEPFTNGFATIESLNMFGQTVRNPKLIWADGQRYIPKSGLIEQTDEMRLNPEYSREGKMDDDRIIGDRVYWHECGGTYEGFIKVNLSTPTQYGYGLEVLKVIRPSAMPSEIEIGSTISLVKPRNVDYGHSWCLESAA